jgi:hypothetical protein
VKPSAAELDEFLVEHWHREQIRDALLRYCRGLDRKDFDLVRSAYHDDAIDDHGAYCGDIPGLIAWMRERHRSVEQCLHAITNTTIERSGDLAVAESYCISHQRYYRDGGGLEDEAALSADREREQIIAIVRFIDRFEHRGSGWRIAHRKVAFEAAWMAPVTSSFPPDGWAKHRRDEHDMLWTTRQDALGVAYGEPMS